MKRHADSTPWVCGHELMPHDVVLYKHGNKDISIKPYVGISVCRQIYERLFTDGTQYEQFASQLTVSETRAKTVNGETTTIYTIDSRHLKPESYAHPRVALYDPSHTWSRVFYTLGDVADKFNELADLKAVCSLKVMSKVMCGVDYPLSLLPVPVQEGVQDLGFLHIEISSDGTAHALPRAMPALEKPSAVLHLTIVQTDSNRSHSNVVMFTHADGLRAERFEPHGSDVGSAEMPNIFQLASDFNAFYNADSVDAVVSRIASKYGAVYVKPLAEFPVMGQSISNQNGKFNLQPLDGKGFRRNSPFMGNMFCAAYTAYYMMLRLLNPALPPSAIYAYLHGPANLSVAERGAWSSDQIAHFILWAANKSFHALNSQAFKQGLHLLD